MKNLDRWVLAAAWSWYAVMLLWLADLHGAFARSWPVWRSDANLAAWVQAVGSVAAILVAVAVPWWQRETDGRVRKRNERSAAFVVCAGARLTLGNVLLLADLALNPTKDGSRKSLTAVVFLMDGIQFPSDAELLMLVPVVPNVATRLARIRTTFKSLEGRARTFSGHRPPPTAEQQEWLLDYERANYQQMREWAKKAQDDVVEFMLR